MDEIFCGSITAALISAAGLVVIRTTQIRPRNWLKGWAHSRRRRLRQLNKRMRRSTQFVGNNTMLPVSIAMTNGECFERVPIFHGRRGPGDGSLFSVNRLQKTSYVRVIVRT
jgi:hypothetical protein